MRAARVLLLRDCPPSAFREASPAERRSRPRSRALEPDHQIRGIMAQVNMQQVKELRDRTQAGLNDCRSALVEAEGDMDKAVEIILKKGLAKSAKRAGAVASEGVVLTRVSA